MTEYTVRWEIQVEADNVTVAELKSLKNCLSPCPFDTCTKRGEHWHQGPGPSVRFSDRLVPCSKCATTMGDPCHECHGDGFESAANT